jgi:hypothetical protein
MFLNTGCSLLRAEGGHTWRPRLGIIKLQYNFKIGFFQVLKFHNFLSSKSLYQDLH